MQGRDPPDDAYEKAKAAAPQRVRLTVEFIYEKGEDVDSTIDAVAAQEGENPVHEPDRPRWRRVIGEALQTFNMLYRQFSGPSE